MNDKCICIYEERFATVESDVAELKARLDSKRDDIHSINNELLRDRQHQNQLLEKVTRVTVLLEEGQKQRTANNGKLTELEDKIDKLQDEIVDNKQDIVALSSSLSSFRNTMLALIPIVSIIISVVLHFIPI